MSNKSSKNFPTCMNSAEATAFQINFATLLTIEKKTIFESIIRCLLLDMVVKMFRPLTFNLIYRGS